MPLAEAGFKDQEGHPNIPLLFQTGPTLPVMVVPPVLIPNPTNPSQSPFSCSALIDTGASESCIDVDLALSLGLPQIDVITIAGTTGSQPHPVYMCAIVIPALGLTHYGRFAGVRLKAGGQIHQVLLGRTFLGGIIMIYDGIRGLVTLAAPILPPPPA